MRQHKAVHKNDLHIGDMARGCIKKGYGFAPTLAFISAKVPTTKFSKKCYYWYRNHYDKVGIEKAPSISKQ